MWVWVGGWMDGWSRSVSYRTVTYGIRRDGNNFSAPCMHARINDDADYLFRRPTSLHSCAIITREMIAAKFPLLFSLGLMLRRRLTEKESWGRVC